MGLKSGSVLIKVTVKGIFDHSVWVFIQNFITGNSNRFADVVHGFSFVIISVSYCLS